MEFASGPWGGSRVLNLRRDDRGVLYGYPGLVKDKWESASGYKRIYVDSHSRGLALDRSTVGAIGYASQRHVDG